MFSLSLLLHLTSLFHPSWGHYYTPHMPFLPFEHLHTDTAIEGPQPWFDGEVPSKDHCFHKCLKNFTDCEYVQYKEATSTTWLCKLYGVISDLSNYLVSQRGEMLAFAVHKNMECKDWKALGYTKSGVYYIFHNRRKMKVYCVMGDSDAWIRIQRRQDGSVNFNRRWQEYKEGFGDPSGEFWLGNENIHHLTKDREMMIYFRLWTFDNDFAGIGFRGFRVDNETEKYRLHTGIFSFGKEEIGQAWLRLNRKYFSTRDADNDGKPGTHCAVD